MEIVNVIEYTTYHKDGTTHTNGYRDYESIAKFGERKVSLDYAVAALFNQIREDHGMMPLESK